MIKTSVRTPAIVAQSYHGALSAFAGLNQMCGRKRCCPPETQPQNSIHVNITKPNARSPLCTVSRLVCIQMQAILDIGVCHYRNGQWTMEYCSGSWTVVAKQTFHTSLTLRVEADTL